VAGKGRIDSGFNLGGEQAEADPLLEDAFYESGAYSSIVSKSNRSCFLVGRTGSGKSAILQRLEETVPDHVVRVNPEDLSLPYVLDLGVVQQLDALNVHLDPLFIALWKHVLLVELIKHRYRIDSPETKRTRLSTLRDLVRRDTSKKAALEYLDEFGGSFWCETDERVREIISNFERKIGITTSGQATLPGLGGASFGGGVGNTTRSEVCTEQANRYQRIVNETQLPRLNKMIAVLDEDILDSPQVFTYVIIDDLDRDWVNEDLANDLIRCLFRATLDLQRVRNLKVVVALRTNIFEHLNFGSRTGGQEEKFRSLSHQVRWTRVELEALADERARIAAKRIGLTNVQCIRDLLPMPSRQRRDPFDFLLDRTLMRPRDVIAFLNECFSHTTGKSRLAWGDLQRSELEYSKKRLLALRDEWKPTFPDIDKVFQLFRRSVRELSRDQLTTVLDEAALLTTQDTFAGVRWMTDMTEALWSGTGSTDWATQYQELVKLLYDIGFIGIRESGRDLHYSYVDIGFADSLVNLGQASSFVVHPAFRAALDVVEARGRPAGG
jgi:hypothetical protein